MSSFNVYFPFSAPSGMITYLPFSMRSIHPFFSSRERITHNSSFWIFVVLKTFSIVKTFFYQFFKYANSHSYALSLTVLLLLVYVIERKFSLLFVIFHCQTNQKFLLGEFPHYKGNRSTPSNSCIQEIRTCGSMRGRGS